MPEHGINPAKGMGLFLFFHDDWKRIYYQNCTLHHFQGYTNVPVGLAFAIIGLVCELIYIPFLIVMWQQEFMKISCYKFMFLLGIVDMCTNPLLSILTGIQCLFGLHFCSAPYFFYVTSCLSGAGWMGACMTCCVLAIDRFFGFVLPETGAKVFSPKMVRLWLCIPVLYWNYSLWMAIATPFSTKDMNFYFDPYVFDPDFQGNIKFSENGMMLVNSIITVPILFICYSTMCVVLFLKKRFYNAPSIGKFQRIMLFQSLCICTEIFIVAAVYVPHALGIIRVPPPFNIIQQIALIFTHADTPIVYMMFNQTLRQAVIELIRKSIYKTAQAPIEAMSTIYTIVARPGNRIAVNLESRF